MEVLNASSKEWRHEARGLGCALLGVCVWWIAAGEF